MVLVPLWRRGAGRMARTMRRVPWTRSLVSLLLMITSVLVLLFAVLNANPTVPFHSPTATHTGYFSVAYTGVYHYVEAQPLCSKTFPPCWVSNEAVFYLVTGNGNETVRLVFYCGPLQLDYCNSPQQLPFHDGDWIYVKGTLLQPSDWPTSKYQPTLQFTGDLYVFNYTIA
jgi:hypothetical protein